VSALDIDAGDRVPILTDPLAGLAPDQAIDATGLAASLRQRLAATCFAAMLGPKVSVVLDGGSALHLDAVPADIRLRAASEPAGWQVSLGGDTRSATLLGAVAAEHALELAARLLETIARHGQQARAKALIERHGTCVFRAAVADLLIAGPPLPPRPPADPIGLHPLRDGRLGLGIGLAFGHTDAQAFERLIEAAARFGAACLRTAPGRALLFIGVTAAAARDLAAHAESLGFITRRNDPRRHVVACAGAPICASAEIPARALAPLISDAAALLLDGSLTVHISGCRKGCAHPGVSALTIVGTQGGCGLIVDACARDQPIAIVAATALPAALERIAQTAAGAHQPGDTTADTLARLDAAQLAQTFGTAHG